MDEISAIRESRRRLGLTQHALARAAGVSQSLVAKIESGRIDPAYSKVKSLLEALSRQQSAKEKCARDIMHAGAQAVSCTETLHSAAAKMRKHSISQMPVLDGGAVVGSISEQAILAHFTVQGRKMASLRVGDVMEEAFPSALPSTPISAVAALLRHYPAVLVTERGKIAGIITKADLLKTI